MKKFVLLTIVLSLSSSARLADASDDTLKFYLSKSDLVVLGNVTSQPEVKFAQEGVSNYICDFKVKDILMGDAELKGKTIKVNIMRSEIDKFDPSTWTKFVPLNSFSEAPIDRKVSFDNGTARMQADTSAPEGPGVMAYNTIATRNRVFTPHLAGTNLFEITLKDYIHEGPFLNKYLTADGASSDHEDPVKGNYLMGFCLAIGTFQGFVGDEPVSRRKAPEETTDRVVQIHFDWYSRAGLWYCLNRSVIAGDKEKIRIWGTEQDKENLRKMKPTVVPNITIPGNSVTLAHRYNPAGDNISWGHRYGLLLTDDGNTLSWLLDGKLMDTIDISGFFSSSPGCVTDGAYATILGGASYQHNVWSVADLRIVETPKDHHPIIKKDAECILFLKKQPKGSIPQWITADPWFGIQHPLPGMARSLKRLAEER